MFWESKMLSCGEELRRDRTTTPGDADP